MLKLGFMALRFLLFLLLTAAISAAAAAAGRALEDGVIRMPTEGEDEVGGTRWALLIAGSSGYQNYRHQADVCHAYQILRANGLKDENIVVMMYDDIANHTYNPTPGKIINNPLGSDVYANVPKDYVGGAVNPSNFYAVLLGDKKSTTGGSGKVIASGPRDHVFVFYSDHGGPGVLGMPSFPYIFADDFVSILKQKHANGGFGEMVIYLESCESGSMFEGLLPEGLGIYVTTAANAVESSWGTYCPGMQPAPPVNYGTCLGDLYSVSWMEDSERHNLKKETLLQQYLTVKDRTSNHNTYNTGSHVMQYGDVGINSEEIASFLGFDPANTGLLSKSNGPPLYVSNSVNQRDADLAHFWHKYNEAPEGSAKKAAARKELTTTLMHRIHVDRAVEAIMSLLFGSEDAARVHKTIRPSGQVLVDDWQCLKSAVPAFEASCGPLGQYGMKHMRAFANICNEGVSVPKISAAAVLACSRS